ncbi:hypothetical protein HERIO_363 [Hepatospora eriocheir]|uniref:Uncharacterized protein n=1 Tax=Hepatospora eriocheir TaxID=1081669 RepID=A0A1X0QDE4_9MICR|nr:hypothetical protein HERIO_363 [Hepatospora eriocheir]
MNNIMLLLILLKVVFAAFNTITYSKLKKFLPFYTEKDNTENYTIFDDLYEANDLARLIKKIYLHNNYYLLDVSEYTDKIFEYNYNWADFYVVRRVLDYYDFTSNYSLYYERDNYDYDKLVDVLNQVKDGINESNIDNYRKLYGILIKKLKEKLLFIRNHKSYRNLYSNKLTQWSSIAYLFDDKEDDKDFIIEYLVKAKGFKRNNYKDINMLYKILFDPIKPFLKNLKEFLNSDKSLSILTTIEEKNYYKILEFIENVMKKFKVLLGEKLNLYTADYYNLNDNLIQKQLFKKVDIKNKNDILNTLKNIIYILKDNNIEFWLHDIFLNENWLNTNLKGFFQKLNEYYYRRKKNFTNVNDVYKLANFNDDIDNLVHVFKTVTSFLILNNII